MPKIQPDLAQRMSTPWVAFGLAVGGGACLGRDMEPVFRVGGFLFAVSGAALLAIHTWRSRQTMAQVLAAIPLEDKSEGLLHKLPKAWAALEHENRDLRTQAELEDQVRRHILNPLKAGVLLLGQDRRIRIFNPASQTMLGSSSNLEVGQAMVAAFREPESLRCLDSAFAGSPAEWILLRSPRMLQLRAIPLPSPSRDPDPDTWVLVTLDDVTRQEALETTRQKFISNASHELKTPVTSIRLAVENLQEGAQVLASGDPSLRIILRSVDRMTMLLEDISELSRIETGALHLQPVPLRLDDFLSDLLDNVSAQATPRNVRIRPYLPVTLEARVIQADPLRLSQLLENLLSNAIKFSPANSEVVFKVTQERTWLLWTVADQGPGIGSADAKRVFERFYRAPSARAIPGTGLGLAIAKHLAFLMGGEIELHSELGKGATFTFRLPLADKEVISSTAAQPPSPEVP